MGIYLDFSVVLVWVRVGLGLLIHHVVKALVVKGCVDVDLLINRRVFRKIRQKAVWLVWRRLRNLQQTIL